MPWSALIFGRHRCNSRRCQFQTILLRLKYLVALHEQNCLYFFCRPIFPAIFCLFIEFVDNSIAQIVRFHLRTDTPMGIGHPDHLYPLGLASPDP